MDFNKATSTNSEIMTLLRRVYRKYRNDGFRELINAIILLSKGKYKKFYHRIIRPKLSRKEKLIILNGVEVPIPIVPIDTVLPYYNPPWPTEDDPDYEHTEVEAIREHCSHGDEVLIIGGGLGVTATIAANIVGSSGHVIVYEGSERTYEKTKKTIEQNGVEERVTVKNAVISEFKLSNFTFENEGYSEIISPKELPEVDLYEMDCEGAETSILSQMTARPDTLLVETHDNHDEVVEILKENGYGILNTVTDGVNQSANCTHVVSEIL